MEWAVYPYFPDKSLLFARIDAAIFDLLVPFSPILMILLLYTWPVMFAASLHNRYSKRFRSYLTTLIRPFLQARHRILSNPQPNSAFVRRPQLLLFLAIATAIFLGVIPYRPDLNPSMTPVGVDAHFYIDALNQMLQQSPASAISYSMGNAWASSRPLLLVPMYLASLTGLVSVNQTVEALPTILGPLLALSTFFFVKEGSGSERIAGIASMLSVLSFTPTVGLWAGFYANWLALSEAYLFLGMLFSIVKKNAMSKFIAMTLLSVGLLLTHPWTWLLILTISMIYSITLWRDSPKTDIMRPLAVLIAIDIIIDLTRSLFFGGPVATQDASASLAQSGASQTLNFWLNITNGLFSAYNGLLANAVVLAVSLISMIFLSIRNRFERVLALWIATGSIPLLFVSSLIQTRIIYDLPLSMMTSIGLFLVIRPLGSNQTQSNLAILLMLLLNANYALAAATNLVSAPF